MPLPDEPKADCARCPMARPGSGWAAPRFRPDLKCCTYHPRLPNYLLGGILADEGAAGPVRERLRHALDVERTLTPAFFGPSAAYGEEFGSSDLGFGRDPGLRCPFLGEAGCGIWRHRNHQCTTYFCLHEDAVTGQAFWHALRAWLSYAQNTLARHCCTVLGVRLHGSAFDGTDRFARRVEAGSRPVSRTFGPFADDPLGFLVRCHDIVSALSPAEWGRLTGPVHERLIARLEATHGAYMAARAG